MACCDDPLPGRTENVIIRNNSIIINHDVERLDN